MTLPSVPGTFRWTDEPWGAALRCRPLEPIAPHLFTTRQLELSSDADVQRMAYSVGANDVAMLTQVHGNAVVAIADRGITASERPEADALVSDACHTAIAVRAADCVPLLMADARRGVVAAVHAGWRGTAARVAAASLQELGARYGTRPSDVVAAIGPSIGSCCYEVGTELVDAFAAAGHERYLIERWFVALPPARGAFPPALAPAERPKLRLDVAGANRDQLVLAGVPEEAIHIAGLCTAMHLDVLTSYRVEKARAGRLAGVIRRAC